MALQIANLLKNDIVRNVAIGLGVAIVVPLAARYLAPLVRPVGRSMIKAGMVTFEKTKETAAEIGEIVEDLVADVRDDLRQQRELAEAATIELPQPDQPIANQIDQEASAR